MATTAEHDLTARQRRILSFIESTLRDRGYADANGTLGWDGTTSRQGTRPHQMITADNVRFDDRGLCVAVAQDRLTGAVRMVAWMNRDALEATITTRKATFFSRSRNRLWVKGEESGNHLVVHDVALDCDGDTLLILVDPLGPSCHTGSETCFFEGSDACVAPVLSLREAPHHPHLAARGTFTDFGGITQPAPAPRFSATHTSVRTGPAQPGADTADVAHDWGIAGLLPDARGEGVPAEGAALKDTD